MTADPPGRIPRIKREEWDAEVQAMFDVFAGPGWRNVDEHPVMTTFARHPPVATLFLAFNEYLLTRSTFPVRPRQIAILRVAWLRQCRYLWSSHLRTTTMMDVSDEVIEPVKAGADAAIWTDEERLVLRATDMLVATSDLDDATWDALAAIYSQKQLLDFLFTVGAYVLVAGVMTPLRIEREPELVALAEKYGCPF